jgi:hypothetical protein
MMADPDEALIEAIRAIGREHRPSVVDAIRHALVCACGVKSTEPDGLERHRAELIHAATVEHLGLVEETRLIHAPHARVGHVLVLDEGWKWGADGLKQRRLVSRWVEVQP